MKNILATLFFSQGTPLLLAGDEFGRTQRGNNNVFCQDSEISWVDWELTAQGQELQNFTRQLIRLREEHGGLRRNHFLTGVPEDESRVRDVIWINANGLEMDETNWSDANIHCFGMMIDGRAPKNRLRKECSDKSLLLIFNGYHEEVSFTMPVPPESGRWVLLLDTNLSLVQGNAEYPATSEYIATGRSVLLFKLDV